MKEWLKLIFIILAFIGFMLAIGTVGALELDNISNEQFLRQALISFGIFIFSVIGYKAVNWEDDSEMHQVQKILESKLATDYPQEWV